MKYPFILLLVVLSIACNSKKTPAEPEEPRAGGPCTYRYDTLPATVIKIRRENNQPTQVAFAVKRSSTYTDTTSYFMVNGKDISEEEIKQHDVKEGNTFQFIAGEIKTGTCNPSIKHIDLNKYTGQLPAARDTARGDR